MTLTVNNIIDASRSRLDETNAAQWTNTELKRWLNEGARDLARRTRHLRDTDTFTTTAGTAEYTIPADVLEIEQVYYAPGDGRQIPLVPRAFEGMNAVWGQNQATGGQPAMYTLWGTPPNLKIRLFPVPDTSSKTVTTYVVRLPASITENDASDTTALEWPLAWVDLLKDYVEYCALRKDRDPTWQEAYSLYNQRVDDMIVNSEYMNVPREVIADPMVAGGVVPRWIADPSWGGW